MVCLEMFSVFVSITQFSDFWVMSYENWKHILGVFKLSKLSFHGILIIKHTYIGPTVWATSHQRTFWYYLQWLSPSMGTKSLLHLHTTIFFSGKLYYHLHTTTDRSLDPPSSPYFQNQETNFSIQTISKTNLNPKQTQPQLHKNQTPEARKRRKRDRVQNWRPNPRPKNHTQKTFHFTNPKPKIDKLRNPNWGYPITKSVQRAEMKTRTRSSRDVEREREVLGEGN